MVFVVVIDSFHFLLSKKFETVKIIFYFYGTIINKSLFAIYLRFAKLNQNTKLSTLHFKETLVVNV